MDNISMMQKIGEGWQYTAYKLSNGRVYKRFHSYPKAFWIILKDVYPFDVYKPTFMLGVVRRMREKARKSKEIILNTKLPANNFGNPQFKNGLDYEQDLVTPLQGYLPTLNESGQKKAIDAFIVFNQKLLRVGFIDKSFNVGKNFGVKDTGKIVLIDIGELINDEEKISRQIKTRAWTRSYVLEALPEYLHDYFISRMDKAFMVGRLNNTAS